MNELYSESFKIVMKEIGNDTNKLIDRQVNIVMVFHQNIFKYWTNRDEHRTRQKPEASLNIWKLNLPCINKTLQD